MPEHNSAPHTFQKDGIYYFNRRVPAVSNVLKTFFKRAVCLPAQSRKGISIVFALVASQPLYAASSPDLTPSNFGPIEIAIDDQASDGCWTNIGEAKTYAEDKLENLGYDVVEDSAGTFSISVLSNRLKNGSCYGSIELEIFRGEIVEDLYGLFKVGETGGVFYGVDNSNTQVLNYIKDFIDELEQD